MRKFGILLVMIVILGVTGCINEKSKNNDRLVQSNENIGLKSSEWRTLVTETSSGAIYGSVFVKLNGTTTCEKVTIETTINGLTEEETIIQEYSTKNYNNEIIVSKTSTLPSQEIEISTVIRGYKDGKIEVLYIKSGKLKFVKESVNMNLTKVVWSTELQKTETLTFGNVNLTLEGTTDCDSVTIMTYGDGVPMENELKLVDNKFSLNNSTIRFTHLGEAGKETSGHTVLRAYKGDYVKEFELSSGVLTY